MRPDEQPPRARLFLVRHGQTDWNVERRVLGRSEVGLNERGREEAAAIADALRRFPLQRVVASPQRRAQETAAAIARAHSLPVQTSEDFAEVWVAERWVGKKYADLRRDPELERYLADPTRKSDRIEDIESVKARVVRAANALLAENSSGDLAVVSHGDPLRVLLAHFLCMPVHAFRQLELATGSVSAVRFCGAQRQVILVNWRPPGTLEAAAE